ncbi:hemic uptake protein hemP [Rhodopirellula maiorica SM1]|uniref:Hemic uptake protein hemP n=1 Tax=Rhodopirellula maiorica SM1 TaxID=1265738 RepID=M5RMB1_9BACT|nr:hemin uptake protein HemP [Rhodopirellula maiorica]EMI20463.1 hemic uptake protein hemP [Rhodopirellula maiorica SM1]
MTNQDEPLSSGSEKSSEAGGVWNSKIAPKIVRFKDLSRCGDEIWIEHEGMLYRLRETRQGKLILTK